MVADSDTRQRHDGEVVPGTTYRVLSIHPEWAWAIMFAGKDIENRDWPTSYRGRLLIHASMKKNPAEQQAYARQTICELSALRPSDLPAEFPRATILGSVELVDCVEDADSPWASGVFHWILRDPRPLHQPIVGIKGKLKIWPWTAPEVVR